VANKPVVVELELGSERLAPVLDAGIPHDGAVTVGDQVLVTLVQRMHAEVGDRDPDHYEVDPSRLAMQAVAQHRHRVGDRREPEIAVERSAELGGVATRRW
jgi:hypothetical protein